MDQSTVLQKSHAEHPMMIRPLRSNHGANCLVADAESEAAVHRLETQLCMQDNARVRVCCGCGCTTLCKFDDSLVLVPLIADSSSSIKQGIMLHETVLNTQILSMIFRHHDHCNFMKRSTMYSTSQSLCTLTKTKLSDRTPDYAS